MPYASITGPPKTCSISVITCGGNDAEDERTKRRRPIVEPAGRRAAMPRIAWCMVGTAVYQDGVASSYQPKNLKALKPGVQTTEPPADRVDKTAAINPWIWKSGMMLRQVSSGVSA